MDSKRKGRLKTMFVKTIRKSTIKTGGELVLLLLAGGALLIWPAAVATGVSRGLSICGTVIIPSLFPFMVLAGFLVRSGICEALGRRLEKPTRFLFGLPGCCAAGILVGFVGGYPAGGVAVGELVRSGQITQEDGRRMLRFCVNAGPAFIISAVGMGMLGSVQMGVLLLAAHLLASLVIGIVSRLLDRPRKISSPEEEKRRAVPRESGTTAFVESVNAACRSLLYMCGFVILFAALLALCDVSGLTEGIEYLITLPLSMTGADTRALQCLFPCLLEVSCGVVEAAHVGTMAPFMLGMALGWGGLSVHCQLVASLHKEKIMGKSFFAARAVHAVLGGTLTLLLLRFVPLGAAEVFAPSVQTDIRLFSTSVVPSVALLLMCSMLLLMTAGKEGKIKISLEKRRKE